MKTKAELEKGIINITLKIYTEYPELVKYISEMPTDISTKENSGIQAAGFKDYFNSLQEVVMEYAKTHNMDTSSGALEFPGYPRYPASEDIYSKGKKEMSLNPSDLSKRKAPNEEKGTRNEKEFDEDMTGEDLDVPGSELDDQQESVGSEDEENNYYSIGGDNHNDLEEDNG